MQFLRVELADCVVHCNLAVRRQKIEAALVGLVQRHAASSLATGDLVQKGFACLQRDNDALNTGHRSHIDPMRLSTLTPRVARRRQDVAVEKFP